MATFKEWVLSIIFLLIAYLLISWHRNESQIEDKIFELVNKERIKVGIHELGRSASLNSLAKTHSKQMLVTNSFEHSNDNVGENIFDSPVWYWTSGCGITITNNQIANCMVKGWKESPGHYANMVKASYSSTGIGATCNIFECKSTQNFR